MVAISLELTTLQYLCHYNVQNVHLSFIRIERHWLPWNCCRSSTKMRSENVCEKLCAVVVEMYVQCPPAGS